LLSYLPKRSTEICRAQYGNAMLVSLGGTPTWPPEINENIWNPLLLFKRYLFSRELLYNHISFPPNVLTVQTAKNHKESDVVVFFFFCIGESFVTDAVLVSRRVKSQNFNTLFSKRKKLPG